ncbi:hypothetical protein AMTR_s00023p00226950 [Amborella trichopoda]|uniref:Uncharacterized protein n=2 Tax=Amborella trichopoda TaxID=13333 RepID=W1NIX3_AMBTC|nr:hypothetical protein AMTR_s00023p00226950 [Amborella trichopoda]
MVGRFRAASSVTLGHLSKIAGGSSLHNPMHSFYSAFSSSSMSPPSKAVIYEQQGQPDQVARVVDLPEVELKENDVCIKMLAAPITPSDINRIEG